MHQLANSVLIEWVNNNNNFCIPGASPDALSLEECKDGDPDQQFTMEADGSIRHQGQSTQCLDVYNCQKADGTSHTTGFENASKYSAASDFSAYCVSGCLQFCVSGTVGC